MARTKSGIFWVGWANANAKNSNDVDDLEAAFMSNAKAFIEALKDAGATVNVTATRRSPKRAYLFHWCWKIGVGRVTAPEATPMDGVDIEWDHGDAQKSIAGAREMIEGFGLAAPKGLGLAVTKESTNPPSLTSHHISGKAIDMVIAWTGTIKIKNKHGVEESVAFMADVNKNTKLHAVGASYGVMKLTTDAPHWSHDGH